jgi:methionyl-tRNA formyltransferase
MTPWPGAFTQRGERSLSIRRVRVVDMVSVHPTPGEVVALEETGPVIACGLGTLRILDLVPAGGRLVRGPDFARGHHVQPGERWGDGGA